MDNQPLVSEKNIKPVFNKLPLLVAVVATINASCFGAFNLAVYLPMFFKLPPTTAASILMAIIFVILGVVNILNTLIILKLRKKAYTTSLILAVVNSAASVMALVAGPYIVFAYNLFAIIVLYKYRNKFVN